MAVQSGDEDGGRYRIRTYDFHRVNFEVANLKPFACFAFPLSLDRRNILKGRSFGDELLTSLFLVPFTGAKLGHFGRVRTKIDE